jgi:hypothetical protein
MGCSDLKEAAASILAAIRASMRSRFAFRAVLFLQIVHPVEVGREEDVGRRSASIGLASADDAA